MITFQNVTGHYGCGSVIDGLSLAAPGGKITVFIGPSGCGKKDTALYPDMHALRDLISCGKPSAMQRELCVED